MFTIVTTSLKTALICLSSAVTHTRVTHTVPYRLWLTLVSPPSYSRWSPEFVWSPTPQQQPSTGVYRFASLLIPCGNCSMADQLLPGPSLGLASSSGIATRQVPSLRGGGGDPAAPQGRWQILPPSHPFLALWHRLVPHREIPLPPTPAGGHSG